MPGLSEEKEQASVAASIMKGQNDNGAQFYGALWALLRPAAFNLR